MDTTTDDFLGGKLHLFQPKVGLRATSDSVILAACVPAKQGESLLDVGCGNGVVALCVASRVKNLILTGLEIQPELADLTAQNATLNNFPMTVICEDLSASFSLKGRQFHHVVSNPPFYKASFVRADIQQKTAYHQQIPLAKWIALCLVFVAPKGSFTTIIPAENVPEILPVLEKKLGNIELIPLFTKKDEPAKRCILRGILGSKAPFRVLPGIIGESDNPIYQKICRLGESF